MSARIFTPSLVLALSFSACSMRGTAPEAEPEYAATPTAAPVQADTPSGGDHTLDRLVLSEAPPPPADPVAAEPTQRAEPKEKKAEALAADDEADYAPLEREESRRERTLEILAGAPAMQAATGGAVMGRPSPTVTTPTFAPPAKASPAPPAGPMPDTSAQINAESYQNYGVNDMTLAELDRHSTFSIDVDTASYSIARRKLTEGVLPPEAAVRVEEFVNYFPYQYAPPGSESRSAPFAVHLEAAPHPFESNHHLVRVGVKGKELEQVGRKAMHLTFLVDTSGSMSTSDKIGLAKSSLSYLTSQLGEEDTIAIATYAGSTTVVLKPTPASERTKILSAIDGLGTGGGTAMGTGMELAYQLASQSYTHGAENRVIVLSDGDANIGRTTHDEILSTVKQYSERGITLSTIGFGMGNYKDVMMEQLANQGDGNYYYIDTMDEAKKVFGKDLAGTLQVIAKDVKIQVEFNPEAVHAYRLVGYENRDIADRDFRNDAVDAGEIGAGHMVTALYDVVLKDGYRADEVMTVRLRAKQPGPDSAAKEWSTTLKGAAVHAEFASASKDLRLAFGAASFAELLRGSPYAAEVGYDDVLRIVRGASRGSDEERELIALIEKAAVLDPRYGPVSMR